MEVGWTAAVSESWQLYTDVTDHDSGGEEVGNTGKGRESCLKVYENVVRRLLATQMVENDKHNNRV